VATGTEAQGERRTPRARMACVGQYHSVAVTEDGELLAWGAGESGQLGLGAAEHRHTFSTSTLYSDCI
jgi:alpha-tubulin suppressor-like RCC1 family protein